MTDQSTAAAGRRASFGFIFVLALMNSISFGIMIPVLPNLIKEFTGGDTASAASGTWSSARPGACCSSCRARYLA